MKLYKHKKIEDMQNVNFADYHRYWYKNWIAGNLILLPEDIPEQKIENDVLYSFYLPKTLVYERLVMFSNFKVDIEHFMTICNPDSGGLFFYTYEFYEINLDLNTIELEI